MNTFSKVIAKMARSVKSNRSEQKLSTSEAASVVRNAHNAPFFIGRSGSLLPLALVLLFSILLPSNLRGMASGVAHTGNAPKFVSLTNPVTSQPAALTSPVAGSKLVSSRTTFVWTTGTNVTAYQLILGTTGIGSKDLFDSGAGTATSVSAGGLPMTGVTIYAQLSSEINGIWNSSNYTFTAAAGTPALRMGASSLTFGSVAVNSATTQSILLSSTGNAALTVTSATVSGTSFSLSGATIPLTLNPGQAATLVVGFNPASAGAASGTLTLASNSSGGSSNSISLSGTGVPVLSAINCSNSSMTGAGSDSCTVALNAAAATGGFTVSVASNNSSVVVPSTVTVPAGAASAGFTATVSAVSAAQSTTLTAIAGSVSQSFALQLNAAVPTLSISAPSLSFGNVAVNAASSQSITLSSTGTAAVTVNSATLSGAGFSISGATFPLTLNPNQTASLTVQFDPTAAGAATGTLVLSSNSSSGTSISISLSGSAATPGYAVALSWNAPASSSDPVATYNVYRSPSGSSTYQLMGSINSSELSYNDSNNLQSGQSYDYIVESVDAAGNESAPSNMVCVTIPGSGSGTCAGSPATPALSALSCTSASMTGAGADTCTVTLSAVAPAGGITVNLASDNSLVVVPASIVVASGATSVSFSATASAVTSAQVANLTASGTGGTETFSLALNAYLPALTVNAASIAFGDVNLNTPSTQYVTVTSTGTAPVTVNAASISGIGFTFAGASFPLTLNANQTATFSVAFDPTTAGAAAGQLIISSTSSSNPTAAIALSGTGQSTSYDVALAWNAPSSSADAVAGYNIYRAPSGSSAYQLMGSVNSGDLSYTDTTSVQSGQTYDYIVESVDASGNESVPSNMASVSVP